MPDEAHIEARRGSVAFCAVAATMPAQRRRVSRVLLLILLAVGGLFGVVGAARAAPGDFDLGFGVAGKLVTDLGGSSEEAAYAVAVQADGKIVAAGWSDAGGFALARYTANGLLDASFGNGGKVLIDLGATSFDNGTESAWSVAVQPDGKIVVAGHTQTAKGSDDFAVVRYTADGVLDASFGSGGKVTTDFPRRRDDQAFGMAIQSDGKIVVVGWSANPQGFNKDFALARYDTDGALDASFGVAGRVLTGFQGSSDDFGGSVAIQPGGRIIVAGSRASGSVDFAVARYKQDGSLDPSFGTGGKVLTDFGAFDAGRSVAIERSRVFKGRAPWRIVVGGTTQAPATPAPADFALARYKLNGTLDTSFGAGGKVVTDLGGRSSDDELNGIKAQKNGKIIAAGFSSSGGFSLVRYNLNGSLDSGFGVGGKVLSNVGPSYASAVAIQTDGKIVLAGGSVANGTGDFALARYLGS